MSDQLKPIIEALVFLSQDPLTLDKIQSILEGTPPEEIQAALNALTADYASPERGISLRLAGGGYVFSTKPEHDGWIRRLLMIERKSKLSAAGLETLSAIAYHQPVTQAEISAIRGVDSSGALRTLLDKKLIKIVGRKKAPGNPLVYRTSERFLQYFGLNSLDELPSTEEIARILQEDAEPET
ncbi:MAG: SMC-Scp complex subunit ScpB [Acidobacteriota bacterium]|nr:SMC-Scp complex subunit ScpB [Acidobacteriota bacterium]